MFLRTTVVVSAVAAALLTFGATGALATDSGDLTIMADGTAEFTAQPGQDNTFVLTQVDATHVSIVGDSTIAVTDNSGGAIVCTGAATMTVACPTITSVNFDAGDGDDAVTVHLGAGGTQWSVSLGDGGDKMTVDGGNDDTFLAVDGGPGDEDVDATAAAAGEIQVDGGDGNDAFEGGSGDDNYFPGLGDNTFDGNGGSDTFHFEDVAGVVFGGALVWNTSAGNLLISDTETAQIIGGNGINIFQAGSFTGRLKFNGGGGNDTLIGGPGVDELVGGNGNDSLQGMGKGANYNGGAGSDAVLQTISVPGKTTKLTTTQLIGVNTTPEAVGAVESFQFEGSTGKDTIDASLWGGGLLIEGGGGNDVLTGGNNATHSNVIHGDAGNDIIKGLAGVDQLFGDGGNDNLSGGAGADKLVGGAGTDSGDGGPGSDSCTVETKKNCP